MNSEKVRKNSPTRELQISPTYLIQRLLQASLVLIVRSVHKLVDVVHNISKETRARGLRLLLAARRRSLLLLLLLGCCSRGRHLGVYARIRLRGFLRMTHGGDPRNSQKTLANHNKESKPLHENGQSTHYTFQTPIWRKNDDAHKWEFAKEGLRVTLVPLRERWKLHDQGFHSVSATCRFFTWFG